VEEVMSCSVPSTALLSDKDFSLPTAGGVVRLRPVLPEDREFLLQVYAATRSEEMKLVDWDDAKKNEFLQMQFSAQDKYYREHYASASFWVVLFEDRPCGRLYIDRWDTELRIIDIALLPDYRNRGIGTALLQQTIEEGSKLALPVTIHVEQFNPALRLYQRLGFLPVRENGIYLLMKQSPGQPGCKVDLKGTQNV
jgi:ribosomal protein S18 acetylase RimI-like enzyme